MDSDGYIDELAVLGWIEGLKIYPKVVARADETAALALEEAPDVAVLIDSWGFTLRVAQRLRRLMPELPIVKYVGPQVWASRPGRAKTLAAAADLVLTLQPFEPPYFEAAGLEARFVGHPALDRPASGDAAAFRVRYAIPPERPIVLVLFGSRAGETARIMPAFIETMARLKAERGENIALVAPLAALGHEHVEHLLAPARGQLPHGPRRLGRPGDGRIACRQGFAGRRPITCYPIPDIIGIRWPGVAFQPIGGNIAEHVIPLQAVAQHLGKGVAHRPGRAVVEGVEPVTMDLFLRIGHRHSLLWYLNPRRDDHPPGPRYARL